MNRTRTLVLATQAALAVCAAQSTLAQQATKVEPIVVTATKTERSSFDVPASIDSLDKDKIQDSQQQVNLSETLSRVPGIVVQNRQNYAQDLQISSRGFGSRSTFGVRGVRLIADDIPLTMPDGQGQGANVALGSARRIEVLRGPFSAIYGNSSGGVIQAFSEDGTDQPTVESSLWRGSYGSYRVGVKALGKNGPLDYVADASHFETDGYRDHSAAMRTHGNAKLTFKLPWDASIRVIGNAFSQPRTQDPLGLTRAQFDVNPRAVDPVALTFDTRKGVENNQLGLVYDQKFAGGTQVKLVTYGGIRKVLQVLSIPRAAQTSPTSAGGVVDLDRDFYGGALRATHLAGPLTLSAGVEYDRSKERRKGFENFDGNALGTIGRIRRDEDNIVTSVDPYAQVEWQALSSLSLIAGVRHSRVEFDSRDFYIAQGNPNDSGKLTFSKTNPVAGALFKITPDLNVYANVGRGFETPTTTELAYRPDGASGLNTALKPAVSKNAELGVKARLTRGVRANLAVFEARTDDEIVPATNVGGRTTFQNAPRTLRRGVEASVEATLTQQLSLYLAATTLDATFRDSFTSRPTATTTQTIPSGNDLPGVPKQSWYAELAYGRDDSGLAAALEARGASRVFVNDLNTDAAGKYAIMNVRLSKRFDVGALQITPFARIDNLTDKKYAGSVIVNEGNSRFFEPAPDRNYTVGVSGRVVF